MTHFALDVTVDFDKKVMSGSNTVDFMAAKDSTQIVMDYQGIDIVSVFDNAG